MSGLYALYNNWDHLKGRSPSHYWWFLRAQTMDLFWLWAYSYSLSPPFGDASNFFFFKKPMDHHMCTDFFRVTLGVIFKWKSQTASSCVDYVAWLWLCTVLQAHVFVAVGGSLYPLMMWFYLFSLWIDAFYQWWLNCLLPLCNHIK